MKRTRLFLVHENLALLSQAAKRLNQEADLRIIHLVTSTSEALARISTANCDVILVSTALPDQGALKLLKGLRQHSVPAKVIVAGLADDPKAILAYIAGGAAGYVLTQEGVHLWAKHIRAVGQGKPLVSPAVTGAMMMQVNKLSQLTARYEPKSTLYAHLTARENEILKLMVEGYSNHIIAEHFLIGIGTVKNYVHNVLRKLKLRSRKDATVYRNLIEGRAPVAQVQYL